MLHSDHSTYDQNGIATFGEGAETGSERGMQSQVE